MTDLQLLDLCDAAYDHADITAGPNGRDGASVTKLPTGEIVVAFRGTLTNGDFVSLQDWWNDLRIELVSDADFTGRVHAGFLEVFRNLWPRVSAVIAQWFAAPLRLIRRVIYTGHSLGAYIAQLAGWVTAHLKPRVVGFASPMGFDAEAAMAYPHEVDLTLYQAADDIVPYLPPYAYRTAVTADIVSQGFPGVPDGVRRRLLQASAHKQMADLLDPFKRRAAWAKVVQAHHVENYRAWLKNMPPDNSPPEARAA